MAKQAKQSKEEVFKCTHEGCTYVARKAGYLKQHEQQKHGGSAKTEKVKKNAPAQTAKCASCGGGSFKVLNSNNSVDKLYIDQGYTKYCESCKECC